MERQESRALCGLFNPKSVAVVGASATRTKWGNILARGALQGSLQRSVYLVNSRGGTILDQPVYTSLCELPEPPEMVVLCTPAAVMEQTVAQGLDAGAKFFVSITAGMGEKSSDGLRREQRLVEQIRSAGARMLGPNCMGVFDAESALFTTIRRFNSGPIGVISQSGNLCIELDIMARDRGLGLSRVVSVGNQTDIIAEELLEELACHDNTDVIIMYVESFRDGRRFVEAARMARDRGKPVVLITVGGSEASARAAMSHTGALVGDSDVIDAACRAAGAVRVLSPEQAIQVAQAMLCPGRAPGPRVGIVADGGGHGAIAAELATSHGLQVPSFSLELATRVAEHLPDTGTASNPVDLAGAEKDLNVYERVIGLVLNSGEVDAVLFSGFFGGFGRDSDDDYDLEIDVAARLAETCLSSETPLFVHSMNFDTDAAQKLRDRRVPVFWSADGAVRSLSMAIDWRQPVLELQEIPIPAPPVSQSDYWSARMLMGETGIPFPKAMIARSTVETLDVAGQLAFPLVIKAIGLQHKSDSGGVVLNVGDSDELARATNDLLARLQPESIAVEEMAPVDQGIELIVGARWDRTFGPLLLVGFGGIYAEVLRDFVTALAPVDAATVKRMLRSLRLFPLLEGIRGKPAMDIDSLAEIAARFSRLAAEHPEIAEMEMNPVLVTASGAIALDSRIVLSMPANPVDIPPIDLG